jgi:hypothetical protein
VSVPFRLNVVSFISPLFPHFSVALASVFMSNQMLSNIIASSKLAPTMDLENSNDKVENMEPEAEQETSECYTCQNLIEFT